MNDTTNAPEVKAPATLLDLSAMMDQDLDSIPDAPDYSNPPAGEYLITVKEAKIDSYKDKTGAQAQRLKVLYEVAETIAVADPNEAPVPNGTMFSETFQGTEQGVGFFKSRIKALMNASDLTGVTLGDMMASVAGTTVGARISIKKSPKKDVPGEFYENLMIKIIKAD